ncbi:MAG TPA: 2-hydroxyacid dehydrogenase [Stellaceae bacterium]|nr:2-hydroxyacid dehydrogenase [Stellaceae bacterium]
MTEQIVFLDPITDRVAGKVQALLPPGFAIKVATERNVDHHKALISDADYAISADIAVSEDVFRAAKKLKLLHKWGVGIDNFDLDAARALNIKVARTTGSNAVPVAEFAIGLMIATQRRIAKGHFHLRQGGHWLKGEISSESFMLSGKTVGIVGFGAIGQNVARMLAGFGCRILYYKPTRLDPAAEVALRAEYCDLGTLLAAADVVSLHCPLTPHTRGMIGRAELQTMKNSAILVNVARGGVVIEEDLIWALRTGEIRAAATDVFDVEPTPADNPLLHMDNVVVTPHCAALAVDNFDQTVLQMLHNITCVAEGRPIPEKDVVVG